MESAGRKDPQRADAITRVIAGRVASLRKERGLSGAKLGAAVRELGVKGWVDSTVGKLETLRRESVTVTELMALAEALDVPLVWLLADPSTDTPVPVTATSELPPWDALLKFIGRTHADEPWGETWSRASEQIQAALIVTDLVEKLVASRGQVPTYLFLQMDDDREESRRRLDDTDRERLRHLAYQLGRFEKWKVQSPTVPEFVIERAQELGVDLPGVRGRFAAHAGPASMALR